MQFTQTAPVTTLANLFGMAAPHQEGPAEMQFDVHVQHDGFMVGVQKPRNLHHYLL